MRRKVANLPSSVKDRLRNHARQAGETFNQILIYYALERFLLAFSITRIGQFRSQRRFANALLAIRSGESNQRY